MFDLDVQPQDPCRAGSFLAHDLWERWRSEAPQLRRESSQCAYGSWDNRLGCVEEDDCKIEEEGERELMLVVSVKCGKERDMTRG